MNNVCVNSNDSTWGSVSIDIAKVPQNRVEGLEEALEDIVVCVNDSRKRVGDLEQNKNVVEDKLYCLNNRIDNSRLNLNVFKSAQTHFNEDQIGINLAHFALIKEIHKTLIIGFSILVVFMLATWGYLTYTFFNH
jgi:mevalonate pyrophosphate decarboxylase